MTNQDYMDMNTGLNTNVDPSAFSTNASIQLYTESSIATTTQGTITLDTAPNSLYPVSIYINNSQLPVLYSITSDVVTLASALNEGDKILVVYYA